MRLAILSLLLAPTMAQAEPVRIDGPLEAELVSVAGAQDIVVIVPGSGPIDRDGNGPSVGLNSDTYRLLAESLADHGIASLRMDKRGFFGSAQAAADPNSVAIGAYAADTRAWVARARAEAPCVWIAGHSEGGLVALVAAQVPPEGLCGLILISTSGRAMGQLLVDQFRALPGMAPLMPDLESTVAGLERGETRDPATLPPGLQPLFAPGLQRYMIDLFSYDPLALARGWTGPVLIVQGDADMQVKPQDADLLAQAMPQARRVDLPGATHMLKADVPGQPFATYSDPSLPLHPGLVPAIAAALD